MFVTTLEMDNFDCTKMNACFQKFTACLQEGLIHEWKQALLAPPLLLMLLNNSCSVTHTTAPRCSSLLHCNNNGISRILVKAQSSTRRIGPQSTTRLGIRSQDLGLPNEYSLGYCTFLLLLHTSSLSQAGITHYSQQLTLQHSTKLLFVFFFVFVF